VNGWQALAIVALIAATAGWTTAIVLATRQPAVAVASPSVPEDVEPTDDETVPPVADTHDAPELEALLPAKVQDTPLQLQSWTGDTILTDDGWSTSLKSFLTGAGKTSTDLRVAQAYDPTQALDGSVGVYRVDGVDPAKVRDALIAAWKVDFADAPVSTVTIAGKEVTKVDFGEDALDSYLYIRDDAVFDIESTDEAIVASALEAVPAPGSSPRPAGSAAPGASSAPPSSASPAASAAGG
jgi:hypothetical protein